MTPAVREMVREWVALRRGDQEATARWMRDTLRLGGIVECRRLVAEAMAE